MKMGQDGGRALDWYGNEVGSSYDNGLELDLGEGNLRAFRNRFTNTYATLSFQPIRGGPAYAWRNVVLNVAHEQLKFPSLGGVEETVGIYILHNTFLSTDFALLLNDGSTSHDFLVQGNLFVGSVATGAKVVEWTGGIDGGDFEGDGWFPDGRFDFEEAGDWANFAAMAAGGQLESAGTLLAAPDAATTEGRPTGWRGNCPQGVDPSADEAECPMSRPRSTSVC